MRACVYAQRHDEKDENDVPALAATVTLASPVSAESQGLYWRPLTRALQNMHAHFLLICTTNSIVTRIGRCFSSLVVFLINFYFRQRIRTGRFWCRFVVSTSCVLGTFFMTITLDLVFAFQRI